MESQFLSRSVDDGLTTEETDEPPVTRKVPGGGERLHDLFVGVTRAACARVP